MIAVSNTTPLRYLIAIGQENLFGELFERLFVPLAVHEELTESRTPELVRQRVLSLPAWYEVRTVSETRFEEFPATLHRGEREAILLAEQLTPDILLIDDHVGREIASSRKLPLSRTLGVLERADALALISDFPGVLDSLKMSGFFIAGSLYSNLMARHRYRRRSM